MSRFLLVLLAVFTPALGAACAGGFRHGYGLSLEALVNQTDSVVLARFSEDELDGIGFTVEEVLKHERSQPVDEAVSRFVDVIGRSHHRLKSTHRSEDFNGHNDSRFWLNESTLSHEPVFRSEWRGGMCTPAFTFLNGEQYLLFLDSPGSYYAAEIIKSNNDHWYKYVLESVSGS